MLNVYLFHEFVSFGTFQSNISSLLTVSHNPDNSTNISLLSTWQSLTKIVFLCFSMPQSIQVYTLEPWKSSLVVCSVLYTSADRSLLIWPPGLPSPTRS